MLRKIMFMAILLPLIANSQNESKFGIKFHGFVKSDLLFDSRQTVDVREGHFLLYPKNELLDPEGSDINAQSSYSLLSIQTRLQGFITGPDIGKAKTSAYIEGEFFGMTNADINGFRLRHAFLKMKWEKVEILVGQFWHPLFATNCYPGTVSFNTGAPFQPFTRNPQIRFTAKLGGFKAMFTAFSELDFVSTGPNGPNAMYQRSSTIPGLNLRAEYEFKNSDGTNSFLIGASVNYKRLLPRLETDKGYKTTQMSNSYGFAGYAKFKSKAITLKAYGFYGGDAYDMVMLGGYAVTNITDVNKDFVEYSCLKNASYWIDFNTNNKKLGWGLFGGYTKNLGSNDKVVGPVYMRGADIDYVYRVSGRLIWNVKKFRLAPELEYTAAAYATKDANGDLNIDDFHKVTSSKEVANIRLLIGFYYFF